MTQFFEPAARLGLIPPYLFKAIDDMKAEVKARGVDIIDLGVGDPDLPTPRFIVDKMINAVQDPKTHHYPAYSGMNLFREAVARWYQARFGVDLDPAANAAAAGECDIGRPGAAARAFVIPAREDLEIAAQVRTVLG